MEGHACRARHKGIDYPTWDSERDKQVPPKWRGTLVVPGKRQWIIHPGKVDLTSRSLHGMDWRVEFHPDRYSVSIRINAKVVKAKAFTKKRR